MNKQKVTIFIGFKQGSNLIIYDSKCPEYNKHTKKKKKGGAQENVMMHYQEKKIKSTNIHRILEM